MCANFVCSKNSNLEDDYATRFPIRHKITGDTTFSARAKQANALPTTRREAYNATQQTSQTNSYEPRRRTECLQPPTSVTLWQAGFPNAGCHSVVTSGPRVSGDRTADANTVARVGLASKAGRCRHLSQPSTACATLHGWHQFPQNTMSTLDLFTEAESDVEVIARGAFLLRGFVADTDATLLAEIVRISKVAPFRHMVTPAGYRMSAAMTNCGPAGWTTDCNGYRYECVDPTTGNAWPPLPGLFSNTATRAAKKVGYKHFAPDACLIRAPDYHCTRTAMRLISPLRSSQCHSAYQQFSCSVDRTVPTGRNAFRYNMVT